MVSLSPNIPHLWRENNKRNLPTVHINPKVNVSCISEHLKCVATPRHLVWSLRSNAGQLALFPLSRYCYQEPGWAMCQLTGRNVSHRTSDYAMEI